MTDLKQAAQQALECLRILDYVTKRSPRFDKAITTLEAALAAPPQRQPLTDEEINALSLADDGSLTVREFVRAIEKAHNIDAAREKP